MPARTARSGRIEEERVDGRAPCRPEGFGEDAPRLFLIDVAQHVEPAVDEAVADRGDDDVADAAVRHAGELLLRNFAHWFSSSGRQHFGALHAEPLAPLPGGGKRCLGALAEQARLQFSDIRHTDQHETAHRAADLRHVGGQHLDA
jgi:hypothetical protein